MSGIDPTEEVKKVAKIAQLRKTEICKEDKGISDMQSFVVFQRGDVFECRQSGANGHPFDSLPDVLSEAFRDGVGIFDTVSLVIDSYVRIAQPNEVGGYAHGSLEKEFKSQPKTDVREALTVATYGYHGGNAGVCMYYVYDDKGLPEFTVMTDDDTAKVKSEFVEHVMTKYIEFCKRSEV
jgi:hypothetical protein